MKTFSFGKKEVVVELVFRSVKCHAFKIPWKTERDWKWREEYWWFAEQTEVNVKVDFAYSILRLMQGQWKLFWGQWKVREKSGIFLGSNEWQPWTTYWILMIYTWKNLCGRSVRRSFLKSYFRSQEKFPSFRPNNFGHHFTCYHWPRKFPITRIFQPIITQNYQM